MKKTLIAAAGALIIITGGLIVGNVVQSDAETKGVADPINFQQGISENHMESDATLTSFLEYPTLEKKVDLTKHSANIVKDNDHERVILLKDANNRDQYKSIFVKNQNRLKIVDYHGGMIFNQVIAENTQPPKTSDMPIIENTAQTPEYKELSLAVDLTGYNLKIVEDNDNKRITLFKDLNGHVQYKTIYLKKTDRVKIIEL